MFLYPVYFFTSPTTRSYKSASNSGEVFISFGHLQGIYPFGLANSKRNIGHPGARKDVFPKSTASKTLLFNFKSTMGWVPSHELESLGIGASDYWHREITDYYRFALTRFEMDGLLISMQSPHEIGMLEKALESEGEEYLMDLALLLRGQTELAKRISNNKLHERPPIGHCKFGGARLVHEESLQRVDHYITVHVFLLERTEWNQQRFRLFVHKRDYCWNRWNLLDLGPLRAQSASLAWLTTS